MAVEIERRFLAHAGVLKDCTGLGRPIVQGYLQTGTEGNTRIRIDGDQGLLTRKGPRNGCCRQETEIAIPLAAAQSLLFSLPAETLIRKTRYLVPVGGLTWEVDVFQGRLRGLIIGEVELAHAGQVFLLPDWATHEITHDPRFGNSRLALAAAVPAAA